MKKIFSLGCEIPGGGVPCISLNSDRSLLDADIVVVEPNIDDTIRTYPVRDLLKTYRGKIWLNEDHSFEIESMVKHWRRELAEFVIAGGVAFINLCEIREFYIDTGEKEHSGTGRNRQTTIKLRLFSNYEFIPLRLEVTAASGTSMVLENSNSNFREYWDDFGNESFYNLYLETDSPIVSIIRTVRGKRVVGGIIRHDSGGAFVFLPWVNFQATRHIVNTENIHDDDENEKTISWTNEAKSWGRKYIESLQSIRSSILVQDRESNAPKWVQDVAFCNQTEVKLRNTLEKFQQRVARLNKECQDIEKDIAACCSLKCLLYEKGRALEQAVIEAMRLLGFQAERYQSPQSEFDVVLEHDGQRFIGEIEGRDNKLIDIAKMRQLAMNLREDLQRDDVTVQARGILFGNAHRLTRPSDRPNECFTRKCLDAAKLDGTILIRTCDLFVVANYLSCTEDSRFAAACRDSIIRSNGSEVEFPSIES